MLTCGIISYIRQQLRSIHALLSVRAQNNSYFITKKCTHDVLTGKDSPSGHNFPLRSHSTHLIVFVWHSFGSEIRLLHTSCLTHQHPTFPFRAQLIDLTTQKTSLRLTDPSVWHRLTSVNASAKPRMRPDTKLGLSLSKASAYASISATAIYMHTRLMSKRCGTQCCLSGFHLFAFDHPLLKLLHTCSQG